MLKGNTILEMFLKSIQHCLMEKVVAGLLPKQSKEEKEYI